MIRFSSADADLPRPTVPAGKHRNNIASHPVSYTHLKDEPVYDSQEEIAKKLNLMKK